MHAICTETLQGKAKQGLTLGARHCRDVGRSKNLNGGETSSDLRPFVAPESFASLSWQNIFGRASSPCPLPRTAARVWAREILFKLRFPI